MKNSMKSKIKKNIASLVFVYIIITGLVTLIYTLGFSTGWAMADSAGGDIGKIVSETAHPFNQTLLYICIGMWVAILLNATAKTNKKKIYSKLNFIYMGLLAAMHLTVGVVVIVASTTLKPMLAESLAKEPDMWSFIFLLNKQNGDTIFFILDFAYAVLMLNLIAVILLGGLAYFKVKEIKASHWRHQKYLEALSQGHGYSEERRKYNIELKEQDT